MSERVSDPEGHTAKSGEASCDQGVIKLLALKA